MSDSVHSPAFAPVPPSLRRESRRLTLLGVAGLILSALLLGLIWHWPAALQWLLQSLLIWGFVCWQTRRRLPLNRPDQASPLDDDLGPANRLTLLRAWLIAATGGFLMQPWPAGPLLAWLPGMVYIAAALLDRVDGFVARRSGRFSLLGGELDTVSDALGLAVASLLAVGYGQTHWSYLLLGLAYYAYQGGIYWRRRRGLKVYELPPSRHRRAWAGFQMGYLVVALWPLFYPPLTWIGGFAFMLPALIGFLIDWLVVSGRIDRRKQNVERRFHRMAEFSLTVLQPALRIALVVGVTVLLWRDGLPPDMGSNIAGAGLIASAGFLLTCTMLLLGIAGRYFSLLLLGVLAWYSLSHPLEPLLALLICGVIWLLLFGTGRFSLWLEDERWLNSYDGA